MTYYTKDSVTADTETHINSYNEWRSRLTRWEPVTGTVHKMKIHMYCDEWVKALTERNSLNGLKWSITISSIVCFGLVFVQSCTFVGTFLAILSILGTVAVCIGTMQLASWHLGAVEQIVVSLLFGFSSEYTVHILEGYLEYLHATQSHIFAVKAFRNEAFRGMLLRTGAPILLSSLTVIVSTTAIYGVQIPMFGTVASLVMMVVAYSAVFALLFFGAFLCSIGPTTSYRSAKLMLLALFIVIAVGSLVVLILYLTESTDPTGEKLL